MKTITYLCVVICFLGAAGLTDLAIKAYAMGYPDHSASTAATAVFVGLMSVAALVLQK